MSMVDVICVAGDIRPMKAQDILDTRCMQAIRKMLHASFYGSTKEFSKAFDELPTSVWDWVNGMDDPVQLELPFEEASW